MGRKLIDITGQRFGRLTALDHGFQEKNWRCICDCGQMTHVAGTALRKGKIRSCGCLNSELAAARKLTHGMTGTVEYLTWNRAKMRCVNKFDSRWMDYGGRGIRICDEWLNDFPAFYKALGPRPSSRYSLDRIDVNGHYEPGNVRWATKAQQANNCRSNQRLTWRGETHTIAEWAKRAGMTYGLLQLRLKRRHTWTLDEIMTMPALPSRKGRRNRRRHHA